MTPISHASALVPVEYHTLMLADTGLYGPARPAATTNGLADPSPGIVMIRTGIATGNVNVTAEVHQAPPALSVTDWKEVVEVSVGVPSRMVVVLINDVPEVLPVLTPQGPGEYRIRIHARGRDTAYDLVRTDPVEDYLIQVWPSPSAPETIHKQTDDVGAMYRQLRERKRQRGIL